MGNTSFNFTPEFRRVLDSMGINLDTVHAAATASAGSGQFAPISFNPSTATSDKYFQLKARGIDTGGGLLTSDPVQSQIGTLKKRGAINADVQKLYDSVLKMRAQEALRHAPDTSPHMSFFGHVMDILSRPGRAVTTGMYRGQEDVNAAKAQGKSFAGWRGFDKFVGGLKEGFTGKPTSKTGQDYLQKELGVHNKVAKFAGGLALDIAADPTSYVGFGIAKKALQTGAKTAATEQAAKNISEQIAKGPILSKGFKAPTAEEISKGLGGGINKVLTPSEKAKAAVEGAAHIDKLSTIIGAQAGKAAQLSVANDLTKLGFKVPAAKDMATKWLNPKYATDPNIISAKNTYGDLIKTLPGMQSVKYLDKTVPNMANEAKTVATKQLSEVLNANLEQQIKRTLNLKFGVGDVPVAPIPDAAVKAMHNLAKAPVLNSALKTFDKAFNTGSGFDHDLYVAKSRSAGKAEQNLNIGIQKLVNGFQGIGKVQRQGFMKALTSNPASYGRGVVTLKDGRDAADLMQEIFGYVGKYVDWSQKGLGTISIHKLNAYLPDKYKFDASILKNHPQIFNPDSKKGSQNFLNLIAAQRDKFSTVDPQDLAYHLYIGTEKVLARDRFLRAISDLGVPIKAANLADAQIGKEGNNVAQQLVAKHGYEPMITKGDLKEVDPSMARYVEGKVFHPEVKSGLVKMMDMIENEKITQGFGRAYDRALSYFKKTVTLPMPSYHIRNSIGDFMTSYADGVKGARGMASYAQAAKVLRMLHPSDRQAQIKQILEAPVTADNKIQDPLQQIAQILKQGNQRSLSGNLVMKKNPRWKDIPGQYVSAEQFVAAYQHMGLKRGFVQSDLERELRGNPNLAMKILHLPMDQVVKFSQSREDYFRMAHFIDRIKRSKAPTFEEAAKEAAYYVKKHHFDYTDVTPFERTVMARALPFYKFQRFATPLMLQTFFAHPGRILNAQKFMNNLALAQGYTNDGGFLPTADQIMPEYMRDAYMIPLFEQAGNTVYGGASVLPSTTIFAQTLGGSGDTPQEVGGGIFRNALQLATPAVQIPAEEYFGKRILGKGQVPIGNQLDYLLGRTPTTNLGNALISSGPGDQKLVKFLNAVTGLGLSENTPNRQMSELYRERDQIKANRKKSGYKTPKPNTLLNKSGVNPGG